MINLLISISIPTGSHVALPHFAFRVLLKEKNNTHWYDSFINIRTQRELKPPDIWTLCFSLQKSFLGCKNKKTDEQSGSKPPDSIIRTTQRTDPEHVHFIRLWVNGCIVFSLVNPIRKLSQLAEPNPDDKEKLTIVTTNKFRSHGYPVFDLDMWHQVKAISATHCWQT